MKHLFATAVIAVTATLAASPGEALARTQGKASRVARHVQVPHESHPTGPFAGQTGTASYYASKYNGRMAANGSRYDQTAMTAAHAWLPFGTKVKVTLISGGPSVVVTITDRLPSARRVIDLSRAAAEELGIIRRGIAQVELTPA